MQAEKIFLASDHGGVELKNHLCTWLQGQGYEVLDLGPDSSTVRLDYPDKALELIQKIRQDSTARGILICTTGIGMSMAANRFDFIRGALVMNEDMAQMCRAHNDANVLIFGQKYMNPDLAEKCCQIFLTTPFDGGRHTHRVNKLSCIKGGQ